MRLFASLLALTLLAACSSVRAPELPPPEGTKVYSDANTDIYMSGGISMEMRTD